MLKDLTINTPNRHQELKKKKGRRFSSLITKLERKSYNKNEKGLSEISLGSGNNINAILKGDWVCLRMQCKLYF